MNDFFLLVLIVFGIVLMFAPRSSFVNKKLNQHVFQRRGHHEGQELVSQRLVFTAHATVDEVKRAVLSAIKAEPEPPKVFGKLYLVEATNTHIVYACGNKLLTNFRVVLELRAVDSGTEGVWEIINWTLRGGIVDGQPLMKRLIGDINTALRSVDPKSSLRLAGGGFGNGVIARRASSAPAKAGGSRSW